MAIYELKAPVVDAIQWTGDNLEEIFAFGLVGISYVQNGVHSWLQLSFGDNRPLKVDVGDYIVYSGKASPAVQVIPEDLFRAQYKLKDYLR